MVTDASYESHLSRELIEAWKCFDMVTDASYESHLPRELIEAWKCFDTGDICTYLPENLVAGQRTLCTLICVILHVM